MLERAATLAVSSAALKGGSAVGAMPSILPCSSAIHACAAAHSDRLVQETSDAMNELESYVYAMRDAISTRYSKFATEEEASSISAKLTASEDWLYDEGADATKAVYVAKLDELKADVASIIAREREADDRPQAFKALEAALAKSVTRPR